MAWIDFLICLFFGPFGVHKFKEKKIGMGLLYLFTVGLFGIGWICDCVKYLTIAITAGNDNSTANNTINTLKKVALWFAFAFLLILALGASPSFSSILFLICASAVAPINKWQEILCKFIKGTPKVIAIIVLVIFALIIAPTTSTTEPTNNLSDTYSTTGATATTDDIAFPTTDPTTASSAVPTTVPTTSPTAVPTTAPTTVPTTAPTTVPTTAPTTVPTTAPTTVPTTAPTTPPTTDPPHTHSFAAATCTSPKTCSCGATEGSATGHNYSNGICSSCGNTDPNYVSEILVWIPTKGGKKYHTHSGCSNMDGPIQVTEEEAEAQGFTPCKRCH